jgi:hypothetical protein
MYGIMCITYIKISPQQAYIGLAWRIIFNRIYSLEQILSVSSGFHSHASLKMIKNLMKNIIKIGETKVSFLGDCMIGLVHINF